MKINWPLLVLLVAPLCFHSSSSSGTFHPKNLDTEEDKILGLKAGHIPVSNSVSNSVINDSKSNPSRRNSAVDVGEHNEGKNIIQPISYGTLTGGLVGPGGKIVAYVDSGGHKGSKGYIMHNVNKNSISKPVGNNEKHTPIEGSGDYEPATDKVDNKKENEKGHEKELGSSAGETMGFLNTEWSNPFEGLVGHKPYSGSGSNSGSSSSRRKTYEGTDNQSKGLNNVDVSQSGLGHSDVKSTTLIGNDEVKLQVGPWEHTSDSALLENSVIHDPKEGTEAIQNSNNDSVGNSPYHNTQGLQSPNKGFEVYNRYDGTEFQKQNKNPIELNVNNGAGGTQKPKKESGRPIPNGGKGIPQNHQKELIGYVPNDSSRGHQESNIYSNISNPHDDIGKNKISEKNEGHKPYDETGIIKKSDIDSEKNRPYDDTKRHQETNNDNTSFKSSDGLGFKKIEIDSGVSKYYAYGETRGHQETNKHNVGFERYDSFGHPMPEFGSAPAEPNAGSGGHQDISEGNKNFKTYGGTGETQKPDIDAGKPKLYNVTGGRQDTNKDNAEINLAVPKYYDGTGGYQETYNSYAGFKPFNRSGEFPISGNSSGVSEPSAGTRQPQETSKDKEKFIPYDITGGLQKPDNDSGLSKPYYSTGGHQETIKDYVGYKPYEIKELQKPEIGTEVTVPYAGTGGHQETSKENNNFKTYYGAGGNQKPNIYSEESQPSYETGGNKKPNNLYEESKPSYETGGNKKPNIYSEDSKPSYGTGGTQKPNMYSEESKPSYGTGGNQKPNIYSEESKPSYGTGGDQELNNYSEESKSSYETRGDHKLNIYPEESKPSYGTGGNQKPNFYSKESKPSYGTEGNLKPNIYSDESKHSYGAGHQKTIVADAVYKLYVDFEVNKKTGTDSWRPKPHFDTSHQETNNGIKLTKIMKELEIYPKDYHMQGSGTLEYVADMSGETGGHIGIFSDPELSMKNLNRLNTNEIFLKDLVGSEMNGPVREKQTGGSKQYPWMGKTSFNYDEEDSGQFGDFIAPNTNGGDIVDYDYRFDPVLSESEEADTYVKHEGSNSNGIYLENFDVLNVPQSVVGMRGSYEDPFIQKFIIDHFEIPLTSFTVPLESFRRQVEETNEFPEYSEEFDRHVGQFGIFEKNSKILSGSGDQTDPLFKSKSDEHLISSPDWTIYKISSEPMINKINKILNPYLSESAGVNWSTKSSGNYKPFITTEGSKEKDNIGFVRDGDGVRQATDWKRLYNTVWHNPSAYGFGSGHSGSINELGAHMNIFSNDHSPHKSFSSSAENMPSDDSNLFEHFKNLFGDKEFVTSGQKQDERTLAHKNVLNKMEEKDVIEPGRWSGSGGEEALKQKTENLWNGYEQQNKNVGRFKDNEIEFSNDPLNNGDKHGVKRHGRYGDLMKQHDILRETEWPKMDITNGPIGQPNIFNEISNQQAMFGGIEKNMIGSRVLSQNLLAPRKPAISFDKFRMHHELLSRV